MPDTVIRLYARIVLAGLSRSALLVDLTKVSHRSFKIAITETLGIVEAHTRESCRHLHLFSVTLSVF